MESNDEGEPVQWHLEPQAPAEGKEKVGASLRERVLAAACAALIVVSLIASSLWLQSRADAKAAVADRTHTLASSIARCVVRLTQEAAYQGWSWDAIQGHCAALVLAAAQRNASNAYLLHDEGP